MCCYCFFYALVHARMRVASSAKSNTSISKHLDPYLTRMRQKWLRWKPFQPQHKWKTVPGGLYLTTLCQNTNCIKHSRKRSRNRFRNLAGKAFSGDLLDMGSCSGRSYEWRNDTISRTRSRKRSRHRCRSCRNMFRQCVFGNHFRIFNTLFFSQHSLKT